MTIPTLQQGDTGPSVSALQIALAALGFDVGQVSGEFDEQTSLAVQNLQKSQGVPITGVVEDDTWAILGGQSFGSDEISQISGAEFPSIARAVFFSADIDAYLQDIGIDASTIVDDEIPQV